jgi:hypothetical protein
MKLKRLDLSDMKLIHCGKECPFPLSISDTEIMRLLEKNEKYIYWFQPLRSTDPADQIPVIKSGSAFYGLSLRLMKSIWRHVRLKKNFRNIERSHSGGYKLKIPTALWLEKKRTQYRFHVVKKKFSFVFLFIETNKKTDLFFFDGAANAKQPPTEKPDCETIEQRGKQDHENHRRPLPAHGRRP